MLPRTSAVLAVLVSSGLVIASEPVTSKNLVAPKPNDRDEPIAKQLSIDSAVRFLDSASLEWQKTRKCFTCHTNYAYLYARPAFALMALAECGEIKTAAQK